MRFNTFILENDGPPPLPQEYSVDQVANYIRKNCWQWVREMGKNFFYRGLKKDLKFAEITPRTDRVPTDLPPAFSRAIDAWFHSKFGWYPRSTGVFCTPRKDTAEYYGYPFIFLPVGQYKYIWSNDVHDLYSSLMHTESIFSDGYFSKNKDRIERLELKHFKDTEDQDVNKEELYDILDSIRYTNRGAARNDMNEMMVQCSKYIIVEFELGWDALVKLGVRK